MRVKELTFNDRIFMRKYPEFDLSETVKGKPRSSQRQLDLLRKRRIACHCVGGMAMNDPDLQKLVRRGLMKFERYPYAKGWGGDYDLKRTVAVITPKGESLL